MEDVKAEIGRQLGGVSATGSVREVAWSGVEKGSCVLGVKFLHGTLADELAAHFESVSITKLCQHVTDDPTQSGSKLLTHCD